MIIIEQVNLASTNTLEKDLDSDQIELLIARARTAFKALAHDEAIEFWDRVIRVRPNRAGPWYESAKSCAALGKHGDAVGRIKEAISRRGDELVYRSFLDSQQAMLRCTINPTMGIDVADASLQPNNSSNFVAPHCFTPEECCRRGHTARSLNQIEDARDYYLEAVNKKPGYLTAWKSLVEIHADRLDIVQADIAIRNMELIVPSNRRDEIFDKLERIILRSLRRLPETNLSCVESPVLTPTTLKYLNEIVKDDANVTGAGPNISFESIVSNARAARSQSVVPDVSASVEEFNAIEQEVRKLGIILLAGRFVPSLFRLALDLISFAEQQKGQLLIAYARSRLATTTDIITALEARLCSGLSLEETKRIQPSEVDKALILYKSDIVGYDFLAGMALRSIQLAMSSSELAIALKASTWSDCLLFRLDDGNDGAISRMVEHLCSVGADDQAIRLLTINRDNDISVTHGIRAVRALRKAGQDEAALQFLTEREYQTATARRELAMVYHSLGRPYEALRIWEHLLHTDKAGARYNFKGYVSSIQLAQGPKVAEDAFLEKLELESDESCDFLEAAIVALRGLRSLPAAKIVVNRVLSGDHREEAALLRVLTPFYATLGGDVRLVRDLAAAWHAVDPDGESSLTLRLALEAIALAGSSLGESGDNLSISAIGIDVILRATAERPLLAGDGPATLVLPSMGPGGIQRQVFNTVNGLIANGYGKRPPLVAPVNMAACNFDFYLQRFQDIGANIAPAVPEVYTPVLAGVANRELVLKGLSLLPERSARTIAYFADLFIAERPELVHGWYDTVNVWAGIGARIAGVPRILLGARSIAPRGRRREIVDVTPGYRRLLEFPNVEIVTLCDASAEDFKDWLDLPDDKVNVIYLGVDEPQFDLATLEERKEAVRNQLPFPTDARIVGSAYRFSHEKRPFLWLDGAAEIARRREDVYFLILGDGRLAVEAQRYAERLGLTDRIIFAGLSQDVAAYVGQFDVLLLTSDFEGTSNIVPEAQTLGVPVVATRVGGLPEAFIEGKTGFGVPPDPTAQEIADAIDRALDPIWSVKARPLAQQFARDRFGTSRMVQETANAYGWTNS